MGVGYGLVQCLQVEGQPRQFKLLRRLTLCHSLQIYLKIQIQLIQKLNLKLLIFSTSKFF